MLSQIVPRAQGLTIEKVRREIPQSKLMGLMQEALASWEEGSDEDKQLLSDQIRFEHAQLFDLLTLIDDPLEIESTLAITYLHLRTTWSLLNNRMQYLMFGGQEMPARLMYEATCLSLLIGMLADLLNYADVRALNLVLAEPLRRNRSQRLVAIEAEKLDRLLGPLRDLTSIQNDSVLLTQQLLSQLSDSHRTQSLSSSGDSNSIHQFESIKQRSHSSLASLQNCVINLRMSPARGLMEMLESSLQQAAEPYGLVTSCDLLGQESMGDQTCWEALRDPLLNWIRASVRLFHASGQPCQWKFHASSESDELLLILSDGLPPVAALATLSPIETDRAKSIEDFIFQAEREQGSLKIHTNNNQHLELSCRFKESLITTRLLTFRSAGNLFSLPLHAVNEVLIADPRHVSSTSGRVMLQSRSRLYPLLSLSPLFGQPHENISEPFTTIVIEFEGFAYALVIDDIDQVVDAMVEAIPVGLPTHSVIAGLSLLGGNTIVQFLNATSLKSICEQGTSWADS